MFKRGRLARVVLVLLFVCPDVGRGQAATAPAAPATANWAFLGRWQANLSKSDLTANQLVITGNPSGDMTIALQGMVSSAMAISLKVIDRRSFELTQKMQRQVFSTARYTVAADGRTMTADAVNGTGTNTERSTLVFERQ